MFDMKIDKIPYKPSVPQNTLEHEILQNKLEHEILQNTLKNNYLRTFVSCKDFPLLIQVLKGIKNDTLKNEVSVLILEGATPGGKSTLIKVMEQLAPSTARIPVHRIDSGGGSIDMLNKSLVVLQDPEIDQYNYLSKYHTLINDCDGFDYEFVPGVVVVAINHSYKIPLDKKRKRMPMSLHFPNSFKYNPDDIVSRCVEEFNKYWY